MGIEYGADSRAASTWSTTSEFDDFLSAAIGEEMNGQLSVISMLGRLNIDPRKEAFQLANLPGSAATRRLASLIESLPGRTGSAGDAKTIAAQLVARLPRRAHPPPGQARVAGKLPISRLWIVILAAALVFWLVVELLSTSSPPRAPGPPPIESGTDKE